MKKTLFRITAGIAAALICVSALAGCGKEEAPPAPEPEPAELPSIYVTTETGAPVVVREYENVTVSLSGSKGGEYDFSDAEAEMKCRGNSTYHLPKKPYRIKFKEKINMLGQGGGPSKSWVLLANYNDASMLRNHVAFAMGKKLDAIGFTSSSSFVHLYMNGKYRGVYELVEHHGEGKYRIDMNEDPNETDTDYLIELDEYQIDKGIDFPYTFQITDRAYVVKSDVMNGAKWKFLYNFFKDVDAAAIEGKRERVEELVDLPSFVDSYLLEEITKDPDAGISSFFYLKKAGGKLYCTCPWDFDISLGNDQAIDDGSPVGMFVGNPDHESHEQGYKPHRWFSALMRQKWFCDLVAERWEQMKEKLETAANEAIDGIENVYADEMRKNFEAWALTGDADKWESYAEDLREWIKERFDFLEGWFSDPETLYSYVK